MNAKKIQTLPADTDKPCNCCGRTHRKLYLYQGYWMGQTCLADYELYLNWRDRNAIVWQGWEKRYEKVHRMVTGK